MRSEPLRKAPRRRRVLAVLGVAVAASTCGRARQPPPITPAPEPGDLSGARVAEAPPSAPAEAGSDAAEPDVEESARQVAVREVEGRAPEIEVLFEIQLRGRRSSWADPLVEVLGANLAKGSVLVRTYDWAGYARSADIRERIEVVDLRAKRRRTVLRWAGTEHAAGGPVLGVGSYTKSLPGDARTIAKLVTEYGAEYWGNDLLEVTGDGSAVVTQTPREGDLLLLDGRGRRLRPLFKHLDWNGSPPPALSPGGGRLAVRCSRGELCVVELETGDALRLSMDRPGNPLWVDDETFYVPRYDERSLPDREYSFDVCLLRVAVGESLAAEEVLCEPAWVVPRSLFPDPAGRTAAMTLRSPVRGDTSSEVGVLWLRLEDGVVLGRRALPARSEVVLLADGPLLLSVRDPEITDGFARSHQVHTVLDLTTGDRVVLGHDLLGGYVAGFHRTEHDGREVVLAFRQPDTEVLRFELIRIDLASAFPPRDPSAEARPGAPTTARPSAGPEAEPPRAEEGSGSDRWGAPPVIPPRLAAHRLGHRELRAVSSAVAPRLVALQKAAVGIHRVPELDGRELGRSYAVLQARLATGEIADLLETLAVAHVRPSPEDPVFYVRQRAEPIRRKAELAEAFHVPTELPEAEAAALQELLTTLEAQLAAHPTLRAYSLQSGWADAVGAAYHGVAIVPPSGDEVLWIFTEEIWCEC